MKIQCSYCGKWFENTDFKPRETFKGIDEHHNPPKFLTGEKKWNDFEGRCFFNLCREHHKFLHDEILKIMNKVVGTLKWNGSEYWLLQKLSPNQRKEVTKEVFEFTNKWIFQSNYNKKE